MAYTLTTWTESMGTVAKVSALNNLETIYSEAVDYIDAILHGASYYTDAQVAAKFFTAATDGHEHGMIAATLDGLTAQQIIDSGTPSGCIAIWSSTEGSIPEGWYLCDGMNGTPNLQDRFVVGSGGNYSAGSTGGSDTATSAATVTVAGHALTDDEVPLHAHGSITDHYGNNTSTVIASGGVAPTEHAAVSGSNSHASYTGYTGSGNSHGHTASYAGTANQDKRPPFYALCYIQKA